MAKKSVLICDFCGKVIDQDDKYVHEVEREGNFVEHEGFYHQNCFINSFVKDLEELGFEVIRPDLPEPQNSNSQLSLFNFPQKIDPAMVKQGLDLLSALSPEQKHDYDQKKEEALAKVKKKNQISPDFIGDDPEKMKEGTITPDPKDLKPQKNNNGKTKKKVTRKSSKKD